VVDLHIGLIHPVAAEAKQIGFGAHLAREVARVGLVANEALASLIGHMQNGIFLGLVAHGAKLAAHRDQCDGGLAVLQTRLMAVLASHGDGGMDEPSLFLVRMARKAGLRLNGAWLDKWVFGRVLGLHVPSHYKRDHAQGEEHKHKADPRPFCRRGIKGLFVYFVPHCTP
jgi:hypothetical protein